MSVSRDVANTLRAQSQSHSPIVLDADIEAFPNTASALMARDSGSVGRTDTWGRIVVQREHGEGVEDGGQGQ